MTEKNKTPADELHDLLAAALDEPLPEGAEERCLKRIATETGPIPLIRRPPHLMRTSGDETD